jgi:asparaginyl-tRNA synthetase
LELREIAVEEARASYRAAGLREVSVPILVGITGACENVSTLYRLASDIPVHLTQTGQLALEHTLEVVKGVYCVTPSFRTDRIDDRHLNEFTLIEEEICCDHPLVGMPTDSYNAQDMFDVLLSRVTTTIKAIIGACAGKAGSAVRELGGDPDHLAQVMETSFRRLTYSEALELLRADGGPDLTWGTDLSADSERLLLQRLKESGRAQGPVFVTHYPKEIKFFNMKEDDADPSVVQSADLLLPGVGEAVGSAVREHRHDRLLERLTSSTMFRHITERGLATLEDFWPYLEIVRERRTSPHAGYGIGLERLLQYVLRASDIRQSSVQYMLSDMMGFSRSLAAAQSGSLAPGF